MVSGPNQVYKTYWIGLESRNIVLASNYLLPERWELDNLGGHAAPSEIASDKDALWIKFYEQKHDDVQ